MKIGIIIYALMNYIKSRQITDKSEIFHIDHHYPGSQNRSQIVILYAEIGTPDFKKYHTLLKQYAIDGKIDYVLRHHVQVCNMFLFLYSNNN